MYLQGHMAEFFDGEDVEAPPVGLAAASDAFRPNFRAAGAMQHPSASEGELLAIVCHELRGPVAAVRYAARLYGQLATDAPERQQLQAMMERQTVRMNRLIDDLLDVSRVTHGRLALHCERIDLCTVVAHAIETAASEIEARGHRLTSTRAEAPVWVSGDAFRLEQVFVNLLSNAAKYTDRGGGVSIHTEVRGDHAIVRVRDSGIGIARQLLPHIFDLFRQADESGAQAGLGLGLAIVRSLVEMHGGKVTAASNGAGHGSEFTVILPRAR